MLLCPVFRLVTGALYLSMLTGQVRKLHHIFCEVLYTAPTPPVTRAVFWAWNSSSIQLINYFGLEGLVDPLNL